MKITISVDDEVLRIAREQAKVFGTSVNQLVRDYLATLAGESRSAEDIEEFERLSRETKGDSKGWKFNREEIHERR